jgi:hypothetical protein
MRRSAAHHFTRIMQPLHEEREDELVVPSASSLGGRQPAYKADDVPRKDGLDGYDEREQEDEDDELEDKVVEALADDEEAEGGQGRVVVEHGEKVLAVAGVAFMVEKVALAHLDELGKAAVPDGDGEPNLEEDGVSAIRTVKGRHASRGERALPAGHVEGDEKGDGEGEHAEAAIVDVLFVEGVGVVEDEVEDPVEVEVERGVDGDGLVRVPGELLVLELALGIFEAGLEEVPDAGKGAPDEAAVAAVVFPEGEAVDGVGVRVGLAGGRLLRVGARVRVLRAVELDPAISCRTRARVRGMIRTSDSSSSWLTTISSTFQSSSSASRRWPERNWGTLVLLSVLLRPSEGDPVEAWVMRVRNLRTTRQGESASSLAKAILRSRDRCGALRPVGVGGGFWGWCGGAAGSAGGAWARSSGAGLAWSGRTSGPGLTLRLLNGSSMRRDPVLVEDGMVARESTTDRRQSKDGDGLVPTANGRPLKTCGGLGRW